MTENEGKPMEVLPLSIGFAVEYLDGVMEAEHQEIAAQWAKVRKYVMDCTRTPAQPASGGVENEIAGHLQPRGEAAQTNATQPAVSPNLSPSPASYGGTALCHHGKMKIACPECFPAKPASGGVDGNTFQKRATNWLMACFSMEVCRDGMERNHRFLEEALELVQSLGCTKSEAYQLVDYVYGRPTGEPMQELGGVQVTLAALCYPHDLDMREAAERELARVWEKIDKIRAKQEAKPKHSPLPETTPSPVSEAGREPVVSVKPMELTGGRTDYFVSIRVGDREVTPHVFREEYKAAYHVALYDWLLNGGDKPDLVAFGPNDWPARASPPHPANQVDQERGEKEKNHG